MCKPINYAVKPFVNYSKNVDNFVDNVDNSAKINGFKSFLRG